MQRKPRSWRQTYKNEIKRLEKETGRLIDLVVGLTSNEVAKAYERPVGEREKQKLLLLEKQDRLVRKPGSFEELFELAVGFLSNLMISGLLAIWHFETWWFG